MSESISAIKVAKYNTPNISKLHSNPAAQGFPPPSRCVHLKTNCISGNKHIPIHNPPAEEYSVLLITTFLSKALVSAVSHRAVDAQILFTTPHIPITNTQTTTHTRTKSQTNIHHKSEMLVLANNIETCPGQIYSSVRKTFLVQTLCGFRYCNGFPCF